MSCPKYIIIGNRQVEFYGEKAMFAIRQIQAVTSGVVTIALPATFQAKRVEIIVLP